MSGAPYFTLMLAFGVDRRRFTPASFSVYVLNGPDGQGVRAGETDPREPLTEAHGDLAYVVLQEVLPAVPEGASLSVLTTQEYLCGGPNHAGVLNVPPAERIANRYKRKSGGGVLANADQLRAVDALLTERRITVSASRPAPGEEDSLHSRVSQRLKVLMDIDPDGADY